MRGLTSIVVLSALVTFPQPALNAHEAVPHAAAVAFVSPPVGSALNNNQSVEPSPVSCGFSDPNPSFTFASNFQGMAEPSASMSLPSGSQQYLYVGAEAGGDPQSNVTWQPDLSVTAAYSGNQSVVIGRSASNVGSYDSGDVNDVAIAGLGISGYSVKQTFTGSVSRIGSDSGGADSSLNAGPSLSLQYTVPSKNDVVIVLIGGQGVGLLQQDGAMPMTLVNDTYSECGSGILSSVGIFASAPGLGTFTTDYSSMTYPSNPGMSLGAVAYVLEPDAPAKPGAPIDVTAVLGNDHATISWSPPVSDGGASIQSYKATATPGGHSCIDVVALAPHNTCTVKGLTDSVSYTIQVTATNAAGTSGASVQLERVIPLKGRSPELLFDDEFLGTRLSSPWSSVDASNPNNEELECYTPSEVSVSSGSLNERALATPCNLDCPPTSSTVCPYSSGAVQWRTFSFTYGEISVRAKMAGGVGTWPAIWLLGNQCQSPTWLQVSACNWPAPGSSEIDIAEILDSDETHVNQQFYTKDSTGSTQSPRCYAATSNVSKNWHVYTLIWTAGSLTWEIDGVPTCRDTTLVPTTPMFLIIDTAVGGIGGGNVNNYTLPQTTRIDYVRVTRPS